MTARLEALRALKAKVEALSREMAYEHSPSCIAGNSSRLAEAVAELISLIALEEAKQ